MHARTAPHYGRISRTGAFAVAAGAMLVALGAEAQQPTTPTPDASAGAPAAASAPGSALPAPTSAPEALPVAAPSAAPSAPAPTPTPAPIAAPAATPSRPPPPPPKPAAPHVEAAPPRAAEGRESHDRTDHDDVVGHVGIGFIGVSELPLPVARPTGTADSSGLDPNQTARVTRVAAPAIGARIWLSRRLGIDTAIGVSYSGGSASSDFTSATAKVDKQSVFGLLVHGGVPLALADTQHMALLVVPEVTFGMARSNVAPLFDDNAPPEAELRGYRLDAGVRAGAEIHFGFMSLPRLSLEASVGLLFTTEWTSATVGDQSTHDVSTRLTTSTFGDPWDILRGVGNVSARYYF